MRGVRCHVRCSATFWPCLLLLSACAAAPKPVTLPDEVVGTISDARYTGWMQDLCNEGQVTKSLPGCAPLGPAVYEMEIYRVTLRQVQTLDGRDLSREVVVGLASHALRSNYRERKQLRLKKAPEYFRAATGIEFLAWAGT